MPEPQDVASRYDKRRRLWMAAIKWPMYSVAVMPVLLAAGWRLGAGLGLRWDQLLGFLLAAILIPLLAIIGFAVGAREAERGDEGPAARGGRMGAVAHQALPRRNG